MSLSPYTSTLVNGVSDGLGTTETYDIPTRGRRGLIAMHNVTALGNGHSYVDGAAITLPVVIDATHNVFSYNAEDFTIASGSYATLAALAAAIGAATKTGPVAFSTLVGVTVVGDHLRFTSVPSGVNVKVLDVGSTHDVLLAATGITPTWTIAHTKAAGADGAYSATITIQGKDEASGNFYDILTSAVQTDATDRVLQVHPFMAAVANLCATSQLPENIRIKITRTTTNVITRTLAIQLTA